MSDIRHLAVVLLWISVVAQTLFVLRYTLGKYWRDDFVGRALWFKSTAVLYKNVNELLLWWLVALLVELTPTPLLVSIVLSDIWLALGCVWQYIALERQKRQDRSGGTEMGRELDAPLRD